MHILVNTLLEVSSRLQDGNSGDDLSECSHTNIVEDVHMAYQVLQLF